MEFKKVHQNIKKWIEKTPKKNRKKLTEIKPIGINKLKKPFKSLQLIDNWNEEEEKPQIDAEINKNWLPKMVEL